MKSLFKWIKSTVLLLLSLPFLIVAAIAVAIGVLGIILGMLGMILFVMAGVAKIDLTGLSDAVKEAIK